MVGPRGRRTSGRYSAGDSPMLRTGDRVRLLGEPVTYGVVLATPVGRDVSVTFFDGRALWVPVGRLLRVGGAD